MKIIIYVRTLCFVLEYPFNITEVRLVGGTSQYDGRVEVNIADGWGTVCSRYIGRYDADTLCKSMGLK
jgi:hypothetical protein